MTTIPSLALNDGHAILQLGFGTEHGIQTEAWAPLAKGKALTDQAVTAIAERLGRTPSQVILRWHIQCGNVVFPKTMSPKRTRENLGVLEFRLEAADLEAVSALDRGEAGRIGPHPDTFDWISW